MFFILENKIYPMARRSSEARVDGRELDDAFSDVAVRAALRVEDRLDKSDRDRLEKFRDISTSDRSLVQDSTRRFANALERYAEVVARRVRREGRSDREGFERRESLRAEEEDLERVASDLGTALANLTESVATDAVRLVAERRKN